MKPTLTAFFTICFVICTLLSIDSLAQKREKRNLSGFTGIEAGGSANIILSQGNTESVEVEATEDVSDYLITEVKNGTLIIRTESDWKSFFSRQPKVKVYVTFKDLTSINAGGGTSVSAQDLLTFNKLSLDASGGARIDLKLNTKALHAESSGGANILLEGNTSTFRAHASGGSNIKAQKLSASNCEAESSGGANIYFEVTQELTASASGGSGIYYSGNPQKVNVNKSGGANIKKSNK